MDPLSTHPVVEGLDSKKRTGHGYVLGALNYQSERVPRSLRRSGKVFSERKKDGDTMGITGVENVGVPVVIRNARLYNPTMDQEGYQLVRQPSPAVDFFNHDQVLREFYPLACELVKRHTGASQVFAFDHNLRSAQGCRSRKQTTGGVTVQPPAHVVHGDYTLTSAPERLRQLSGPPGQNDTMKPLLGDKPLIDPDLAERALSPGGRYAFINVWRSTRPEPVETYPLAMADARSFAPGDLVVFEIRYADRIGENYFAANSDGHSWGYFPKMTKDEAVLLKVWDSTGGLAVGGEAGDPSKGTFSLHSAFDDPSAGPDAPDRESIEVRTVAIFDTPSRARL
eukprot:Hpha_TRINITY_DN9319_c0_g1::TRINITY_DN9319_c0_g1_i1::g.26022::m.26022